MGSCAGVAMRSRRGLHRRALYHQRVRTRRIQAQRAVSLYREGLARMQDRWMGTGATGQRFEVPHHIYADDLDLFGSGSLYQLLCAARTQMGENILAQWLLAPADIDVIRARHASIADLRNRLGLARIPCNRGRVLADRFASESARGVGSGAKSSWGALDAPRGVRSRDPCCGGAGGMGGVGSAVPLLAVILVEGGIAYALRKPIRAAITTWRAPSRI